MQITEKQLFQYIQCPAHYDFYNNKNIRITDESKLKNILDKTVIFFYRSVLDKRAVPSFNKLTEKYETMYKKDYSMLSTKEYTNGLFLLQNFYNWACDVKLTVIDLLSQYSYTVDDVEIKGELSPISITRDGKYEFVIVDFSSRSKTQYEIDTKLKYSLDFAVMAESDNRVHAIKYHHVKSNKTLISYRTKMDYDRLDSTIRGVVGGINNKSFYPRESFFCNSCKYSTFCRGWN